MRLHAVLHVAIAVLFACVDASSLKSLSNPTSSTLSDQGHVSAQISRRNDTSTDKEERMHIPSLSGIQEAAESMELKFATQVQDWEQELMGKSTQEAFTLMDLDKAGDDLLVHSNFLCWKKFVIEASTTDPHEAIVEALLVHFDDIRLAKMLEAATMVKGTSVIATELQEAQFALWESRELHGSTPLKLFGPDLEINDLFHSLIFNVWYKYVGIGWKPRFPDHEKTLHILLDRYDEFDIAKAVAAAMDDKSLQVSASNLEYALRKRWDANMVSAKTLFKQLGLNPTSDDFLESFLFQMWYEYVWLVHSRPTSAVVQILRESLGDFGLAKMLEAAKKVKNTKYTAFDLERAYIVEWQDMTVEKLFKEIKLDPNSEDFLGSALFQMWYEYVRETENDADMKVVKILKTYLDDSGLAKMLVAAKKAESTKYTALDLQRAYTSEWKNMGIEDVFDKIKLDPNSEDFLGNSLFEVWYRHVRETENDSDMKVVKILRNRLGDSSLAKMLEAATKVRDTEKIATDLQHAHISLQK